jgi:hypothetical protein
MYVENLYTDAGCYFDSTAVMLLMCISKMNWIFELMMANRKDNEGGPLEPKGICST